MNQKKYIVDQNDHIEQVSVQLTYKRSLRYTTECGGSLLEDLMNVFDVIQIIIFRINICCLELKC